MNLTEFNKVNEMLKSFIFDYQQTKKLDIIRFASLHNRFVKCLTEKQEDLALYEDLLIKLQECAKEIKKMNGQYLISIDKHNYHHFLWLIHTKITSKETSLRIRELPDYLEQFNRILKAPKYFYRYGKNLFFISTKIGCALGHTSTIKIDEIEKKITFSYNDHSPVRTEILAERLKQKLFFISPINILKKIYEKRNEGKDNFYFSAIKTYSNIDNLKKDIIFLALELSLGVDCDWLIINANLEYTKEEIENEKQILRLAFTLWDLFGIKPKNSCEAILNLIRIGCNL